MRREMRLRYGALAAAVALLATGCGKKEETTAPTAAASATAPAATGGDAAAKKWIDSEFQPSTLSKDQQAAELKWFIEAAAKQIGRAHV